MPNSSLIQNSFFSLIIRLAPRLANVLLLILIGRMVGPKMAGTFTLASTFLILFTIFLRGLDDLTTRQVSRYPDQSDHYLSQLFILRLVLSFLAYPCLYILIRFGFSFEKETTDFILVLCIAIIPDSLLYMLESLHLGLNRFSYPALAHIGVSILKVTGATAILLVGGKVQYISWIWPISSLIGMLALLKFTLNSVQWLRIKIDLAIIQVAQHWRVGLSFVSITTLMAIEAQIDTIFLSSFHGEVQVGWYGAATTIISSLIMLSQAYRLSIYPMMTRHAADPSSKLRVLYDNSMRYLGAVAIPMATGVYLLAPKIIELSFGSQFLPAAKALNILVITLVATFLDVPNSRMMLIHDRQHLIPRFLLGSVLLNVVLNLLLTPNLGIEGTAISRSCSSFLFFMANYIYVSRHFIKSNMLEVLYRPTLASLAMGVGVWISRNQPVWFSVGLGAALYLGFLWIFKGISTDDLDLLRKNVFDKG